MSAVPVAKITVPKAIPPSSTFGELLRRSKFASYDPSIRQAYAAPPSYVHRGNWGLKRPIANRSRRSAIVLRQFEEHAQYIEWNRAEHQVKVIKSVEEMGITPKLVPQTSWFIGLGQAATAKESGFDSDFCPGEDPVFERVKDERYMDEMTPRLDTGGFKKDDVVWDTFVPLSVPSSSSSASSSQNPPIPGFDSLGKSGKGAYGAKARLSSNKKEGDDALLQPNIQSMTPIEFKRYLEKLRKLRPEFLQYLRAQLQKDWDNNHRCLANTDPSTVKDEELVFTFATEARQKFLHMGFLGRYTNEHMFREDSAGLEVEDGEVAVEEGETKVEPEVKTEAEVQEEERKAKEEGKKSGFDALKYAEDMGNRPSPIRKQPHKLGGLMYATPTALENFFFVKPSSGLVLQDPTSRGEHHTAHSDSAEYVTAFAGITSRLQKRYAGPVEPLYSPVDGGIIAPRFPDPSNPAKTLFNTEKSERQMRATGLELEETPHVVGEDASNKPLLTTRLRCRVVVESAIPQTFRDNPYLPGSREYIDAQSVERLAAASRMAGSSKPGSIKYLANRLANMAPAQKETQVKGSLNVESDKTEKKENRENVLATLGTLLNNNSRPRTLRFGRSSAKVEVVVEDEKKES